MLEYVKEQPEWLNVACLVGGIVIVAVIGYRVAGRLSRDERDRP